MTTPDTLRTLTYEVTREHIDKGVPEACEFCIHALAIDPYLGDGWNCLVFPSVAIHIVHDDDSLETIKLRVPTEIANSAKRFDFGLPVHPDTFTLPGVPSWALADPDRWPETEVQA